MEILSFKTFLWPFSLFPSDISICGCDIFSEVGLDV